MPISPGGACTAIRSVTTPAPVTACRHVACVAETIHQHRPGACDAVGAPTGRGWLSRVSVARHRRDDDMERVRRASAVRRRIGQWLDDLELFDDRAGPAVRDDDRQRVLVLRANMDEVDVQAVDLGDEAREGVEPRFALAPVVLVRPIACELLDRRELHSLRLSATGSFSGNCVALMRRRSSVSSASGTFTRNGRIALWSDACSMAAWVALAVVMVFSFSNPLFCRCTVELHSTFQAASQRKSLQIKGIATAPWRHSRRDRRAYCRRDVTRARVREHGDTSDAESRSIAGLGADLTRYRRAALRRGGDRRR